MIPVRCMYCRGFAKFIWWENGYHHPCCMICYPRVTLDVGSDTGSIALDGSRILKGDIFKQGD